MSRWDSGQLLAFRALAAQGQHLEADVPCSAACWLCDNAVAAGQLRLARGVIRAMVIAPAAGTPTAANRRGGAGGSGRRRQPPRAGARPSETGAYRLPSVAGAGPVVNCSPST